MGMTDGKGSHLPDFCRVPFVVLWPQQEDCLIQKIVFVDLGGLQQPEDVPLLFLAMISYSKANGGQH